MTRDLTPAVEAELGQRYHRPFRLFYGDFPTPWRSWTGAGTLDWGGFEWQGIGDALKMSASQETVDTGSEGLELVLSGVDPLRLALVLSQDIQGRDIEIWFGFLDAAGAVIADPWLEYAGIADLLSHAEDGREAAIGLKVETPWSDTEPTNLRYTDASQRALWPGDEFFVFAAQHSIQPSTWIVK